MASNAAFLLQAKLGLVCTVGRKGEDEKFYDGIDRLGNCLCVEKDTDDFMHINLDMPGLCIDDVEISVEGSFLDGFDLKIQGSAKESEFGRNPRMYFVEYSFPQMDTRYDLPKYEKEMENGLLRFRIPKIVRKPFPKYLAPPPGALTY